MREVWQSFRSNPEVFGQALEVLLKLQGATHQANFSNFISTQGFRLVRDRLREIRQVRNQVGRKLQTRSRFLNQKGNFNPQGACQKGKVARQDLVLRTAVTSLAACSTSLWFSLDPPPS